MAGGRNSAKQVSILARQQTALNLRKSGLSYAAIASKLSAEYGEKYSKQLAHQDVDKCLKEIATVLVHDAEELRALELERLNTLQLKLHAQVERGDVGAVKAALAIIDRRCKLLGLDAPIQVKIEEGVETELRSFLDSLAAVMPREDFKKVLDAYETIQNLQSRAVSAAEN